MNVEQTVNSYTKTTQIKRISENDSYLPVITRMLDNIEYTHFGQEYRDYGDARQYLLIISFVPDSIFMRISSSDGDLTRQLADRDLK